MDDHTVDEYTAILLCAGYGTRLGDLTATTPKPLLPVAGRPVLDYLLDQLWDLPRLRSVQVVSNAHYAGAFDAWAEERRVEAGRRGVELAVHDDGTVDNASRLGAIGDLGFVLDRIGLPQGALVAAGDNIFRFPLRPLWDRFLDRGEPTVLALHEESTEKLRRTGVLVLDNDDRVTAFEEKPEVPPSPWACPSVYGFDRAALSRVGPYLAEGRPKDEIGRFVAHLVELGGVSARRVRGQRLHVGTVDELTAADHLLRAEPVLRSTPDLP
ncbi:MAG: sugar phosphate nucleotidyltransferase [Acidobacteriota bacterium]